MVNWRVPARWTALAVLVALAATILAVVLVKRKESFSLGSIFKKVKDGVSKVVDGGKTAVGGAISAVKGGGGGQPAFVPTYTGRVWTGVDWACPWWSVETGLEDARGCITSQYHNPMWRWDGKEWGWSCPNGTTPTGEGQWEKKCEVGWMGRQLLDKKWQCPWGTEDSGKNWDNASWSEAQKQCRRMRPYTVRHMIDGKWACPPGSTDTGRGWGQKGGEDQCKWNGG